MGHKEAGELFETVVGSVMAAVRASFGAKIESLERAHREMSASQKATEEKATALLMGEVLKHRGLLGTERQEGSGIRMEARRYPQAHVEPARL
jgi:hypothetical protein